MKKIDETIGFAISNNDDETTLTKGVEAYIKEDYENAYRLYTVSAMMGNPLSTSNLGYCYLYGKGIKKDVAMGIHILKLAARQGIVEANYKLGSIYYYVFEDVKKDKSLGMYYIDKAWEIIKLRDLDAVSFPQVCYIKGKILMGNKKKFTESEIMSIVDMFMLARLGFIDEIKNGMNYHIKYLQDIEEILNRPEFYKIAKKFDKIIENEWDNVPPNDFGNFIQ